MIAAPIDNITCIASFGNGIPEYAEKRGVSLDPILADLGISRSTLSSYSYRVSYEKMLQLFERTAEALGDNYFGLNFAATHKIGDLGPIDIALANAPTLCDACNFFLEVSSLAVDQVSHRPKVGKVETSFEWDYTPLFSGIDQFNDFNTLKLLRIARLYAGESWRPVHLNLRRSAPISREVCETLFCSNTTFDPTTNRVTGKSVVLKSKRPDADPRLFAILREHCLEYLQKTKQGTDIVGAVRSRIFHMLQEGKATLANVALALATTERSLQRRLAEYEMNYEDLLDETRLKLSDRLLGYEDLSIDRIAFQCGYSTTSAYTRAVKGWTGKTPGEVRREKLLSTRDQK